jgi:hypothetical protein
MLINVPKTGVWCEQFPAPGLLATNRVKPAVVPVVEFLPWELRDLTEIYLIKKWVENAGGLQREQLVVCCFLACTQLHVILHAMAMQIDSSPVIVRWI